MISIFFYVSHVLWVFVVELAWINSIGVVLLVETSVAVRQCIESVNFRFVFKNWNVFVNINSIGIAFFRKKANFVPPTNLLHIDCTVLYQTVFFVKFIGICHCSNWLNSCLGESYIQFLAFVCDVNDKKKLTYMENLAAKIFY